MPYFERFEFIFFAWFCVDSETLYYTGGICTNQNSLKLGIEIPISEIRQQTEYAQAISNDLFGLFSGIDEPTSPETVAAALPTVRTKLSMVLDFLFQAKSWCDLLEKTVNSYLAEAAKSGDKEQP